MIQWLKSHCFDLEWISISKLIGLNKLIHSRHLLVNLQKDLLKNKNIDPTNNTGSALSFWGTRTFEHSTYIFDTLFWFWLLFLFTLLHISHCIKGIVHFEIKIWYLSAYPKGIQDVGVFFSSVDPILMFLGQTVLVCQSYNGRYRSLSL